MTQPVRTRTAEFVIVTLMDVFVIPIGGRGYALYCEPSRESEAGDDSAPATGIVGRLRHRFRVLLRAAEDRQQGSGDTQEVKGWIARVQDRLMAWVVERIAEQRLLWNLRGQATAVVAHPQDMTFEQVMTLVRRILQRDYERHRRWMVFDGIAFLITSIVLGPFFLLVPGVANLPAAYFGFRVVGHWLSMRGAAHGLRRTAWSGRPCPPLAELRDVAALEPDARDARVHDIAARLRLQHLSTFFDRVAVRHA
jgi:hypothetical protein